MLRDQGPRSRTRLSVLACPSKANQGSAHSRERKRAECLGRLDSFIVTFLGDEHKECLPMPTQWLRAMQCYRLSSYVNLRELSLEYSGRRPRPVPGFPVECLVNLSRSSSRGQHRTCCCSSCRSLGGHRTCRRRPIIPMAPMLWFHVDTPKTSVNFVGRALTAAL